MNNKIIYILIFFFSLSSCTDDFLDKQPISEVTEDTFFKTASELELYTNGFYRMFPHTSIYNGDSKGDNIIENILSEEMRGARIVPTSGGGWSWDYLRDINFFLDNYEESEDEAAKRHYGGIARFFRAYFYFEKLKRYGDVPWYDVTVDPTDEAALQQPRDSRQFVAQKIIEDLDWAIENLNEEQSVYEITKYTALALKSRVGLYEGTFEKYHGMSGYESLLEAAVEASEELINNSPYTLYSTGNPESDYLDLFNALDAQGTEIILSRRYTEDLSVQHNVNYYTTTSSYGMPGMPKSMVNTYLNRDGTRFTDQPNYNEIFFTEEVKDRDPRLSQTIRTPGYNRKGQSQELPPNLGATVTGYQLVKYVTEPQYDTYNESVTDLPIFRYGEVLLNYAEAKAELGNLSQADLDISINKLRDRVEMPHLNLENSNSNPDPYMENQYPNVSEQNKGVLLEIRRERRIELYMENLRWDDIVRWKSLHTLTLPIRGMYFPGPGEYDLDDNGSIDVVLYEGEEPSGLPEGSQIYELGAERNLDENNLLHPHPDFNVRSYDEERDYLYPLPRLELQLNTNLTQNPGWQ